MAERRLLDVIAESITTQDKNAMYACGGSVPVVSADSSPTTTPTAPGNAGETDRDMSSAPIYVRFGKQGEGSVATLPGDQANSQPMKRLIDVCSPASFGRGGEDVLDESYRKASKLDTSEFTTSFCPYKTGIVDVISQILLPNAIFPDSVKRSVCADLYKLNFYSGPSGKFKAHVDTPRSEQQFGSLVVCLPLSHEGGQLVVRNGGTDMTFDWSDSASSDKTSIKWAAFYSDCEHEVLEVTAGHRLTLTYNLFIVRGNGNLAGHSAGLMDPSDLPLYHNLKNALETPGFMTHGRVLGIYLSHNYAHTSSHHNFLPSSLKGSDMVLYETARALGLACSVKPVLDIEGKYDEDGDVQLVRDDFVPFQQTEFNEETRDESLVEYMHRREGWAKAIDEGKMTWLNDWRDAEIERAASYMTYGNSAYTDFIYSAAALFIRIPPTEERGKNVGPPPQDVFEGIPTQEQWHMWQGE